MNTYKKFSYYYDEVMKDINYNLWYEFISEYINDSSKILDLACGSGSLAILLKGFGYDVEGIDLSDTVIEIAKEKAKINHLNIPFYIQDMTNFDTGKKYDVITCFFDSVNFLDTHGKVEKLFDAVYKNLNENGYFIFDIFSLAMFERYSDNCFKEDYETFQIDWLTRNDGDTRLIHEITIKEDDAIYKETYFEYLYDYKKLNFKGFEIIKIVGDFNDDLEEDDEHILIVLKKTTKGND